MFCDNKIEKSNHQRPYRVATTTSVSKEVANNTSSVLIELEMWLVCYDQASALLTEAATRASDSSAHRRGETRLGCERID